MSAKFAPTSYFNSLTENDKKAVLESSLGQEVLHDGLRFAIPIWWVYQDTTDAFGLRNGSAFLMELGQGVIAVTAAHVLREYYENKRTARAVVCQLGNALFDPEACLIDCNDDLLTLPRSESAGRWSGRSTSQLCLLTLRIGHH
jgi:hypothetical protein